MKRRLSATILLDGDEEEMDEDEIEDSESHYDEEFMEEDDDEDLGTDSVHEHEEGLHELAAAVAAAPAGRAVANVTVPDADALECGVCSLVLRPPIFQCELGHALCSACRDKLEDTGNANCYFCGVTTHGYRRCHAMEHLVDRICVPCPYAAYGCDATPPYHSRQRHLQVCPHGPRHCPGESCGFVGSTSALLNHFAGAHSWPCTTMASAGEEFSIRLRVGFNFFVLEDHDRGDGDQVPHLLFLLNVTQERLGRAISVLCIHSHVGNVDQPPSMICKLALSHSGDQSLCRTHCQSSEFKVVCTDLSNGLPSPDVCFQFIVANAVLGEDDEGYIEVKACINID